MSMVILGLIIFLFTGNLYNSIEIILYVSVGIAIILSLLTVVVLTLSHRLPPLPKVHKMLRDLKHEFILMWVTPGFYYYILSYYEQGFTKTTALVIIFYIIFIMMNIRKNIKQDIELKMEHL